ncbi:hypothetical protein, partial [Butyribacter sp.]|uniref:hypothetical protein n=1 Tax=Butyribacter sp. TaxID=2822465 RepID=UPI002A9F1B81|nr:hypothetical protein [Butyribacter sp.]
MRINKKILAIIMICGAMFLTMGYFKSENMISASASNNIRKLKENKEYNIDLDKDGTDEIVKYTLKDTGNDESTYKIVINGKVMCPKKGIYCAYNP